jgi:hypothetical protein
MIIMLRCYDAVVSCLNVLWLIATYSTQASCNSMLRSNSIHEAARQSVNTVVLRNRLTFAMLSRVMLPVLTDIDVIESHMFVNRAS